MSLKTWKAEFYPVTAKQAAKKGDSAAIDQAILKYRGTFKKNLKKHGVFKDGRNITESVGLVVSLAFNTKTCALCVRHFEDEDCPTCPLRVALGCICDGRYDGIFEDWRHDSDPRPMLKALRKARKMVQK